MIYFFAAWIVAGIISAIFALVCLIGPPVIIVPIVCSGFVEHGLQFRRTR